MKRLRGRGMTWEEWTVQDEMGKVVVHGGLSIVDNTQCKVRFKAMKS